MIKTKNTTGRCGFDNDEELSCGGRNCGSEIKVSNVLGSEETNMSRNIKQNMNKLMHKIKVG